MKKIEKTMEEDVYDEEIDLDDEELEEAYFDDDE